MHQRAMKRKDAHFLTKRSQIAAPIDVAVGEVGRRGGLGLGFCRERVYVGEGWMGRG